MIAELDPLLGPPSRRAALAGFAKLTALDGAERLVALVRDERRRPAERAQALCALQRVSPSLGMTLARSMIGDAAGAADTVRLVAESVLREHRAATGAAAPTSD